MTKTLPANPPWLETEATVIGCSYQFARMNSLTLGVGRDENQFLITFTYYAHAKTYTDSFTSPTYLEQGASFPVSYNPLDPQQNTKSASSTAVGTPLFAGSGGVGDPVGGLARVDARLQLGARPS